MVNKNLQISVVIPVYNEQESLEKLHKELALVLSKIGKTYEIIFVDDGSTDASLEVLKTIRKKNKKVRIISFRKNFGQTAALSAGFDYAQGETIITLDADLQNDPRDIPKLLKKIDEGYDVVSGWRKERKEPYFTRILPSRVANWLISKVSGVALHDYGCTLKAYKKEIIKEIRLYGEMHRFI
jgi:glycosyltransferase involved in cell wall biosynthesis